MHNVKALHKTQTPDWFDGMPPRECWTIDQNIPLSKIERAETPVDDRGLVDETALIRVVHSFIKPTFLWPDNISLHHKNWEGEWYHHLHAETNGAVPAVSFRELPSQTIYTPRMFHTLLHRVTLPPPIPDPDVMRWQIAAWRVAHNLFVSLEKDEFYAAKSAVELAKQTNTSEREQAIRAFQQEKFVRNFKGRLAQLDALGAVPEEHWVFNPNDDPLTIMSTIKTIRSKSYRRMGQFNIHRTRRGRRISLAAGALAA